ncbi:MAG TPA: PA2169 family four-helix-bundle protein [Croceibacterium sp.]|nr:PA2169 family four-helix-bundle protein [Croceibacterium sp.]
MANDRDIKVLNDLIKTTLDSHKGFVDAAEDTGSAHAQFFAQIPQERSQVASQMQAQVSALGGAPEDSSSVAAAAHRTFMDIKQAVMGQDDQAVINEVERGEDYIKAKYEAALRDEDLSPQTRQVVEQAYQSIRRGHDQASALKHQMQG